MTYPVPSTRPVHGDELFEYRSGSRKVWCTVCGGGGYLGGRWMDRHRQGHLPCFRCGKQLTVLSNGKTRVHSRCPRG